MLSSLRKPVLAAAFMALSPLAAALPGGVSDAQAHTSSRGHVTIGGPHAGIGFSFGSPYYGNPYIRGRVHCAPAYGARGPIYGYPQPRFYAPYYPAYRYSPYGGPGYYRRSHRDHHRGGSVSIHGPFGHRIRARWH
jgi:hypothetical protein